MKTLLSVPRPVRTWLFIGVVMVFFQIVIGGVTRLTDSGLSITEWKIIQGTIPPLNQAEWQTAFDQYKVAARKQYETLHAGMTLGEFKVIFFWEYFHRLWARLMGFVFLFPFLFFLWKKWLPAWMVRRLGVVIGLAVLAAVFGWIMVRSGLNNDTRTWVSAYKLMTHLGIATALFGYLYWIWLRAAQPLPTDGGQAKLRRLGWTVAVILCIQIAFGGLMAGMRAALIHPHFPVFIEGSAFWNALVAGAAPGHLLDYEPSTFPKVVVQILHRGMAWVLVALAFLFFWRIQKQGGSERLRTSSRVFISFLVVQVLLGILTIVSSVGRVPVLWGALHQATALILLAALLTVNYQFRVDKG